MIKGIRLLPAFMTVGAWTLASRILGFVRDIMIAAFLGAGPVADAFFVAFSLPNLFRRFFAEGAFNLSFVPLFSKKLEAEDGAEDFARDALSLLIAVLLALTIFAQFAMPAFVFAMASGYLADERFEMAVAFGRVAFPYILFISVAALFSGALNAMGRFWAAAAAPVLLNIILITAMATAHFLGVSIGWALTWGVPIAGVAQAAMVWVMAERAGLVVRPRWPRWTPDLRQLAIIAAPAALTGGVVQINLLVGRQIASFDPGAISWLNYADRLYQLPLGLVGIAIGIVLLPDLSRRLAAGDREGGIAQVNRALEFSLLLTLPATAALIVLAEPLVSVLYGRREFGEADVVATAAAVVIYAMGLPAFVLQKVFSPVFFAREDTRTPFRYAVVSMFVNAALAVGLSFTFGYLAAAIGTTVSAWAMLALLWRGAARIDGAVALDAQVRTRVPRILLASVAMGVICWAAAVWLAPTLETPTWRYGGLAVLVVLGMASYAAAAIALGAARVTDLRTALGR